MLQYSNGILWIDGTVRHALVLSSLRLCSDISAFCAMLGAAIILLRKIPGLLVCSIGWLPYLPFYNAISMWFSFVLGDYREQNDFDDARGRGDTLFVNCNRQTQYGERSTTPRQNEELSTL